MKHVCHARCPQCGFECGIDDSYHYSETGIPTHCHTKKDDKGDWREHRWRAPSQAERDEPEEKAA